MSGGTWDYFQFRINEKISEINSECEILEDIEEYQKRYIESYKIKLINNLANASIILHRLDMFIAGDTGFDNTIEYLVEELKPENIKSFIDEVILK